MYRRNYYRNDPYWITARRPGRCGCGAEIKPGDRAMWFPRDKALECERCGARTDGLLEDDDLNQLTHVM